MLKNIILLVCVAALIFVGRGLLKRYPEANKTVTSITKKMRKNCKSSWKSTQKLYKKNINSKAMDKTLKAAKAPFSKFMGEKNSKARAPRRPSNITVVNGELPPKTVTRTVQN